MNRLLATKKKCKEYALERFINENDISIDEAKSALLNIQYRRSTEEYNLHQHKYSVPISLKELAGDHQ